MAPFEQPVKVVETSDAAVTVRRGRFSILESACTASSGASPSPTVATIRQSAPQVEARGEEHDAYESRYHHTPMKTIGIATSGASVRRVFQVLTPQASVGPNGRGGLGDSFRS
jgi:hypothetical protein